MQPPLYSIGHGTRPITEFIALLQNFHIDHLADIRSIPYSKFNPQYNRHSLFLALEKVNIRYVYLGDQLGGRPSDPSCYAPNGKIDYHLIRQKDFFRKGLTRLQTAHSRQLTIALLCSESHPEKCHRSHLIGRAMAEEHIFLQHIDEKGAIRHQKDLVRPTLGQLFQHHPHPLPPTPTGHFTL